MWIGVFFIPFIFAWFTLARDKGYSTRARVLSFGWLALLVLGFFLPHTSQTNQTQPVAAAPAKSQDHATAVSEARTFWTAIKVATPDCDKAADYVSKSIKANDAMTMYENAKAAQNNCLIAAEDLNKIALPASAPVHVQDALKDAIKKMSEGYTGQSQNYGSFAIMANNGVAFAKPSDIVSMRQDMALSQYQKMIGVAKIIDAFKLEGVSMADYGGKGAAHHRSKDS